MGCLIWPYNSFSWVGRLRGERKPSEESPDTTGQDGG